MAYNEAQKRATAKYNAKAYDRIEIKVKKGQKKIIQQHADNNGKSINSYIVDLVREDLTEHGIDLDNMPAADNEIDDEE